MGIGQDKICQNILHYGSYDTLKRCSVTINRGFFLLHYINYPNSNMEYICFTLYSKFCTTIMLYNIVPCPRILELNLINANLSWHILCNQKLFANCNIKYYWGDSWFRSQKIIAVKISVKFLSFHVKILLWFFKWLILIIQNEPSLVAQLFTWISIFIQSSSFADELWKSEHKLYIYNSLNKTCHYLGTIHYLWGGADED